MKPGPRGLDVHAPGGRVHSNGPSAKKVPLQDTEGEQVQTKCSGRNRNRQGHQRLSYASQSGTGGVLSRADPIKAHDLRQTLLFSTRGND